LFLSYESLAQEYEDEEEYADQEVGRNHNCSQSATRDAILFFVSQDVVLAVDDYPEPAIGVSFIQVFVVSSQFL